MPTRTVTEFCLRLGAGALVLPAALAAWLWIPRPGEPGRAGPHPTDAEPVPGWVQPDGASLDFPDSVFASRDEAPAQSGRGPLNARFRLAGTFFAASGAQQTRKAILDDLQQQAQHLVAEGAEVVDEVRLVAVARDQVTLRQGAHEEILWLSFHRAAFETNGPTGQADEGQGMDALGRPSRFGRRVGDSRWVLSRSALMGYYQELLTEPDRLAAVFESLKPVYQADKISGYTLDVVGENDTFAELGLKQGDVVRALNSMPMISQSRAEYFINEFVKDRVSAFVLDIERDQKPLKLVFLVR